MNLSKQIKHYRQLRNFSQEELAERIYVSRQTISNWENERSYPDINNLLLLSVLFDVSLDELVKGDVEMMRSKVDVSRMNEWSWAMIVSGVLGILSIIPALKYLGRSGWLIVVPLFALSLLSSIMIERMKKKNNIKTYSEILAFLNGQEVNDEKVKREKNNLWVMKLGLVLLTAFITLGILYISSLIFY